MSLSDHEAKKATTDADSIVTSLDTSADVTSEELLEAVTELSQQVSELQDAVQEQQDTIDTLRSELDEEREQRGRSVAETRQQVAELEQTVEQTVCVEETPTPEAGQTAVQPDELTPVEQIARADDLDAVTNSASVRRAVTLFQNLDEWGRKAPKGITLKPSDNPLSLLEAACEESLCWKQWYRTAETLESLSEGAVTFFDSDRHGKMICLHEQSEVFDRVTSGELSPSSARAEV